MEDIFDTNGILDDYGVMNEEEAELFTKTSQILRSVTDEYDEKSDLLGRLAYDDELQDECLMNLSMLSLLEMARNPEDGSDIPDEARDDEMYENAYLKVIDSLIRMAKVMDPLGGFGKVRLKSALEICDDFSEKYWPLVTRVTAENIEAFSELLTPEQYDDILAGRKKCIGALRHFGDEVYGAGVCVYRFSEDSIMENPIIRVEYINVAQSARAFGTGNLLMAHAIRPALLDENIYITLQVTPPADSVESQEDDEVDEFEILENFLDSWQFEFSYDFSDEFFFDISTIAGNKYIDVPSKHVKSIEELGDKADGMIRSFFRSFNLKEDSELMNTSPRFYDPHTSCARLKGNTITALMLTHRYENGDYRIEMVRSKPDMDMKDVLDLIRFAYHRCVANGDESGMAKGIFLTEEGCELAAKLVPDAVRMLVCNGLLHAPTPGDSLSVEQWEALRREAGYEPKFSEEDIASSDFSDEQISGFERFLEALA